MSLTASAVSDYRYCGVSLIARTSAAGMTDAVASRAFDPYFTNKERGTGLGLSSVFGFVQQSRGWIRLHTKLGHGTRFLLYLPRAHEEANAADASAARLRK